MEKFLYILFSAFLLISSCSTKKDEIKPEASGIPETSEINSNTAIQMNVGNYWIYRRIFINPDGSKQFTEIYDSIYIHRDSVGIDGRKFYFRKGLAHVSEKLYDSAGCVVRLPDGAVWKKPEIIFSEKNFRDTLYRNELSYGIMRIESESVVVPAGNFHCTVFMIVMNEASQSSATDHSSHYQQEFYAKGVGLVKRSYNHTGLPVEQDLVRYKIH